MLLPVILITEIYGNFKYPITDKFSLNATAGVINANIYTTGLHLSTGLSYGF